MKRCLVKRDCIWWEVIETDEDGEAERVCTTKHHHQAKEIRDALNYCRAKREAPNAGSGGAK